MVEGIVSGFIVEIEVYKGFFDWVVYSFNNWCIKRMEVMFGFSGYVYMYIMYIYCLFNVVSSDIDCSEGVFIWVIELFSGKNLMKYRCWGMENEINWINGFGKLIKVLGVLMDLYGYDLISFFFYIVCGFIFLEIFVGFCVGIDNSGEVKDYFWCFWVVNYLFVLKFRWIKGELIY